MKTIPLRSINPATTEPALTSSLIIHDLEELLADADMLQELHRHDFYFLLAVAEGKGSHEIDFVDYPVKKYTVYIMRPGQVHQLELNRGSKGYLLQFSREFYQPGDEMRKEVLRTAVGSNYYQLKADAFASILAVLSAIEQEYTDRQGHYEAAIRAHLNVLMIYLLRRRSTGDAKKALTYEQEGLEALQELIQQHAAQEKEVSYYAGAMHLTPYQLNAITKATIGKTCSELIREHILLEAKRQLLATTKQVAQVADELGYEDVSYFSRFFRKHMGYAPEAFRNKFR